LNEAAQNIGTFVESNPVMIDLIKLVTNQLHSYVQNFKPH